MQSLWNVRDYGNATGEDPEELNEDTFPSIPPSSSPSSSVVATHREIPTPLPYYSLSLGVMSAFVLLLRLDDSDAVSSSDSDASGFLSKSIYLIPRRPDEPRVRSDEKLDAIGDQPSTQNTICFAIGFPLSASIPERRKPRESLFKFV